MTNKKSILFIVGILALVSTVSTQGTQKSQNQLILITQDNHKAVTSVGDIEKISSDIQNLKAITVQTKQPADFIGRLKQVLGALQIQKQQVSSIITDNQQIKKLQSLLFENINENDVYKVKQIIKQRAQNLLINIKPFTSSRRLLEQTEVHDLISAPTLVLSKSLLFSNMTPGALTGLLVSLFLIIMLLIAINCLYNVQTNDAFGRTNLWVGKES